MPKAPRYICRCSMRSGVRHRRTSSAWTRSTSCGNPLEIPTPTATIAWSELTSTLRAPRRPRTRCGGGSCAVYHSHTARQVCGRCRRCGSELEDSGSRPCSPPTATDRHRSTSKRLASKSSGCWVCGRKPIRCRWLPAACSPTVSEATCLCSQEHPRLEATGAKAGRGHFSRTLRLKTKKAPRTCLNQLPAAAETGLLDGTWQLNRLSLLNPMRHSKRRRSRTAARWREVTLRKLRRQAKHRD